MPVVATHRPGSARRASSHGRSSSSSSLSKKGAYGAGFAMTAAAHSDAPKPHRKRSVDEASIHSGGQGHRISTHRSETHLPRLGGLQRTLSKTTIIDQSPHGSAPNERSSWNKNGGKDNGNEEDWESNSEDGKETTTDEPADRVRAPPSPPPAPAALAPSHAPGPAPVQRSGKAGMFRVHSDESDLSSSVPRSQAFALAAAPSPAPTAAQTPPPTPPSKKVTSTSQPSRPASSPTPPLRPRSPVHEPKGDDYFSTQPLRSAAPRDRSASGSKRHQRHSSNGSLARAPSSTRLISAAALPNPQLQTTPADLSVQPAEASVAFPSESPHPSPNPNLPNALRFHPPPLRKASSRSSITSITRPLPRRLQTLSTAGSAVAPPQVSIDQARGDAALLRGPMASSPEADTYLGISQDARTENDAVGHLRKASFSSLHSATSRGMFSGGRHRTSSVASVASIDTARASTAGATSAIAALRSQGGSGGSGGGGGGHGRQSTDPGYSLHPSSNGLPQRRMPSSASSMSLADGLKRGLAGAAEFVAHPISSLSGPSGDLFSAPATANPSPSTSHAWSHLPDPNHADLVSTFQPDLHARDRSKPWGFGDLMDDHRGLIRTLPIDGKSLIGQSVQRCVALGNGTAVVGGAS